MIGTDRSVHTAMGVAALRRGEVILAPTDTVWGVMCDFENEQAVRTILELKQSRARARPVALLLDSAEQARELDVVISAAAERVMRAFWPGPLTVVVKSNSPRFRWVAGLDRTIGLRVPDSAELQELVRVFGKPVAATSANLSGQKAPKTLSEVPWIIAQAAGYICQLELLPSGEASTVVDLSSGEPRMIREGTVKLGDISRIIR